MRSRILAVLLGLLAAAAPGAGASLADSPLYWLSRDNDRALKLARESAGRGEVEGEYALGRLYDSGWAVERDTEAAKRWFAQAFDAASKAAASRDPSALFVLGEMYGCGCGVARSSATADAWLARAAQRSYPPAMERLAWDLVERETRGRSLWSMRPPSGEAAAWFAGAAAAYRARAEAGDSAAQERSADFFLLGYGVERSTSEAYSWLMRSAAQGNEEAHEALADFFYGGSSATWLSWTRQAAEEGEMHAEANLARRIEQSGPSKKDMDAAILWYRKAAEQGDARSQLRLAALYGTGEEGEKDEAQAASWLGRAAKQGDAEGQLRLGLAYLQGRGAPRDEREGARRILQAAAQGPAAALVLAGYLREAGIGLERDAKAAASFYREAAGPRGRLSLARMYEDGDGVPRDRAEAAVWYAKASESGDSLAHGRLARLYEDGDGPPADPKKAADGYAKALDAGDPFAIRRLVLLRKARR